jgi:hypothetical protein
VKQLRNALPLATVALLVISIASCDTTLGTSDLRKCDLVSNDRCNPGEMCIDPNAEHCVAEGAVASDAVCTKTEDCVGTAICVSDGDEKVCKTKCDYKSSKCSVGLECFVAEPSETPDHLGYCAPPVCDPVANTGCQKGKACISGSAPKCGVPGTAKVDEACAVTKDCAANLTCVADAKKCAKLCYASMSTPDNKCVGSESCVRLLDINLEDLTKDQGACKKPCNSVTDEGCKDKFACHGNSSSIPPQCGAFGTSAVNEFCTKGSDCIKGATCVPVSGGKFKCKSKCSAAENDGAGKNPLCKPEQICIELKDSESQKSLPNNLGACGP